MRSPRVSICLPNLRNRAYLPERIDSICAQTFTDWELVVVDSYSEDGAWEYLCERAKNEPRMRLMQAPRGLYQSWNLCIRESVGDFIYIATSDDNMAVDCLEKLSAALDRHPECAVAHCPVRIFGDGADTVQTWWRSESPLARSLGGDLSYAHIRRAPMDGLLHASGHTVITSVTQALIRRETFDRVGLFPTEFGAIGDFAWHARCGLMLDSIFVPDTWGGWRLHAGQITSLKSTNDERIVRQSFSAFSEAIKCYVSSSASEVQKELAQNSLKSAAVNAELRSSKGRTWPDRAGAIFMALGKSRLLWDVLLWGVRKTNVFVKDPTAFVLDELKRCDLPTINRLH